MSAKQTIEEALHCFLIQNGYEKTTYQQVSKLSGYTRTLVQHHLPTKKHFATSFYVRMLELTSEYLAKHGIEHDSAGPMAYDTMWVRSLSLFYKWTNPCDVLLPKYWNTEALERCSLIFNETGQGSDLWKSSLTLIL